MPLFEYACSACAHEFEMLVRGDDTPVCPACHGTRLERRMSVFAAHTPGASSGTATERQAATGCGHCGNPQGPGACSLN
ncbi:MAG: FmdB family zinc ribbon protein [Vicinamibacterales bacterium]